MANILFHQVIVALHLLNNSIAETIANHCELELLMLNKLRCSAAVDKEPTETTQT